MLLCLKIKTRLYAIFAVVAILSAVITLLRIATGADDHEAVVPNIIIGSICLGGMIVLSFKERRKIARRN